MMAPAKRAIIIWARPEGVTWYWRGALAQGSPWTQERGNAHEYLSIGNATSRLEGARNYVPAPVRSMVRVEVSSAA